MSKRLIDLLYPVPVFLVITFPLLFIIKCGEIGGTKTGSCATNTFMIAITAILVFVYALLLVLYAVSAKEYFKVLVIENTGIQNFLFHRIFVSAISAMIGIAIAYFLGAPNTATIILTGIDCALFALIAEGNKDFTDITTWRRNKSWG